MREQDCEKEALVRIPTRDMDRRSLTSSVNRLREITMSSTQHDKTNNQLG